MKVLLKQLLLLWIICIITTGTFGQTQPANAGFENWVISGLGEDPIDWGSRNQQSLMGFPVLVSKSTFAHSGSFALRLISDTATVPPPFPNQGFDTLPGILWLNGTFMGGPPTGGILFNENPDSLRGFVIAAPVNGDICHIHAQLSKQGVLVGEAIYVTTIQVLGFGKFVVPFVYYSTDSPDSLYMEITAGDPHGNAQFGTEFIVDDLEFVYNSIGISEMFANLILRVFPNPLIDELHIMLRDLSYDDGIISIYDLHGREVLCNILSNEQLISEDISELVGGMYFIKVTLDGNPLYGKALIPH